MSIVNIDPKVTASIYGSSAEPIVMAMEKAAEAMEKKSLAKKIFTPVEFDSFALAMTGITSIGNFKDVGEGGAYPLTSFEEGYKKVIYPHTWKNHFVLTQEMVEDNKILEMKTLGSNLITSSMRTKEEFYAALLGGAAYGPNAKYDSKDYDATSEDNVSMFNKAHPSKVDKKFVQSNMFKTEITEEGLTKVESAMHMFRDDKGHLLDVRPDTIIIPDDPEIVRKVFAVVGSEKTPISSDNAVNFQFGRWNIIIWKYLNQFILKDKENTPYILMDSEYNKEGLGAISAERVKLNIRSDIDSANDNNVWKGRERYNGGFKDWRAFAIGGMASGTEL